MMPQEPIDEVPLRIENLILDLQRRTLYRGSERLHLTPKPFEVLDYLVRNRGKVISKHELLQAVWQGHHDDNIVEVAIRQIRRALGDDREHPRFIETIPGEGYCFIAPVDTRNRYPAEAPLNPAGAERSMLFQLAGKGWRFGIAALSSVVLILALAFGVFRASLPDPRAVNPMKVTRSQSRILSPLLTDGPRLYYQRFVNGRYEVAEVASGGGETVVPSVGASNPELCDIAPDGNTLLLRDLTHSREDDEPVYIQPLVGGPPRRIGKILAYDVAWFPDGKRILYSADGVVYSSDLEARAPHRLFAVQGNAYWFRWAPDNRSIRFTVMDMKTEATSLWEVSADGAGLRQVLPKFPYQQCCGSWTPDGKYFLFQVRVENAFQIWARRESVSLIFRMSHYPTPMIAGAINYRGPLASKDGKKLFVRAEAPKGQFVSYDHRSQQFITLLPAVSARTVAFSRDGNWAAYTSLADTNLWRCRVDGTDCLQLTQGLQQTVLPRWSPDGRMLAFMARHFGGNWGIFTITATGENLQSLSPSSRSDGDPDWSADGQQLVFGNVLERPGDRQIGRAHV